MTEKKTETTEVKGAEAQTMAARSSKANPGQIDREAGCGAFGGRHNAGFPEQPVDKASKR